MYKFITSVGAIAALAATASAHGAVTGVTIDGKDIRGYHLQDYYTYKNGQTVDEHIGWYTEDLDNGFIEPNSFGNADIICHKAASTKGASDSMAKVAAGGTVSFKWDTWPESHVGPVITYVAPYTGDIASVDKTTLEWIKIAEEGYENGQWAAVNLIKNNMTSDVKVPSALAAGKYVFRHEIIALHGAASANGAQNYPFCLNIEVSGSGTAKPTGGVVGTKLYTASEDGIIFNPYATTINYNIPGPKLWSEASSGGAASTPTTSDNGSSTPKPSTTAAPASSAAPMASSKPSTTPAAPAVSAAPVASAAPSTGTLPTEFTIETFITWLESKASGSKTRRHAREF